MSSLYHQLLGLCSQDRSHFPFFFKCQVICFLFTVTHQVDGMIPLSMSRAAALGLLLPHYPLIATPSAWWGMPVGTGMLWGQQGRDTECRRQCYF